MNLMALNLAVDLVNGEKTVSEAREAYESLTMKYGEGQHPDAMQRLLFDAAGEAVANPDEPAPRSRDESQKTQQVDDGDGEEGGSDQT